MGPIPEIAPSSFGRTSAGPTATLPQRLAAIVWAERRLTRAGIDASRADAERLLCGVLGLDRTTCYLEGHRPLPPEAWQRFTAYVDRRADREPLQYILGEVEFGPVRLRVDPRVLIPRPETELLVEAALELIRTRPPGTWVWDVGTGSAALALALAHGAPDHRFLVSDRSLEALALARENALYNGLSDRLRWLAGDLLEPVRWRPLESAEERPDPRLIGIVSNPPYVARREFAHLEPEVAHWEPRLALDGGPDGLQYYPPLAARAAELLPEDGFFACEVGDGQADAVAAILTARREFGHLTVIRDLRGVKRVITAIRQ
jgi:release factor glutamine methyltransferase